MATKTMNFQTKQKFLSSIFLAGFSLAIFLLPNLAAAQVAGATCDPNVTNSCNTDKTGLLCELANGSFSCQGVDSVSGNSSNSAQTSPSPSGGINCNDPDLQYKNGICIPKNQYTSGVASSQDLNSLILKVTQILLGFAGIIAVVFVIIGGYLYMAAGGNEEQAEKGKKTIINFVLGLVVIVMAYAIVTILISTLTGADKVLK